MACSPHQTSFQHFCSNLKPVTGLGVEKFAASLGLENGGMFCLWLLFCLVVDAVRYRNALPKFFFALHWLHLFRKLL